MPMISAVRKLIILYNNCSYRTLGFLVKYRQNATLLQGHFWFAISTCVGLHPCTRPTVSAISILLVLVSEYLMCPTIDCLLFQCFFVMHYVYRMSGPSLPTNSMIIAIVHARCACDNTLI